MHDRIAIGTAQFGLDYGVAGGHQIPLKEVYRILDIAEACPIDTLDTASVYGDSEDVLGAVGVENWKVVSKLSALPSGLENVSQWVQDSLKKSLCRLRIPRLYGLLLHRPNDLLGHFGQELYDALYACKKEGLVSKIGMSIYDQFELDAILCRYPMDLIQAPFNVLDSGLESSGWLERMNDSGTEIQARSVFLQGLLLMTPDQRPKKFNRWDPLWNEWHDWLDDNQSSALKACLDFVLSRQSIHRVIVGVDNAQHLKEIIDCLDEGDLKPPPVFGVNDSDLVNPSRWNLL
jgi:hypothetical protein